MEIKDILLIGGITTLIIGPLWYYFEVIRVTKEEKTPPRNLPTHYASPDKIKIIGVYKVPQNKDVHLVEVAVKVSYKDFDMTDFTQEDPTQSKDNWQVPYDEQYLNKDGTKIIQELDNKSTSRVVFFIYYLNFSKPLITPFGVVDLPKPTALSKRLAKIIKFEQID